MEVSEDLLNAYRAKMREKPPEPLREDLQRLWDDYESACSLSRGPDPTRSEHWRQKALSLAHQLRDRLGLIQTEPRRRRRAAG